MSNVQLEKLNDIIINPVETVVRGCGKRSRDSVIGYDYFQEPFCNIFILAKKNSGKTTLIFNMIQHLLKKGYDQVVYFFVATINKDIIYEKITDMLKYNLIEYHCYDAVVNEDRVNVLDAVLENIKEIDKDNYDYPENIFIFDDISCDLRNKSVSKLLKSNRHYKSKVIISSQYVTDITPSVRLQLDYCLVFKNLSLANLRNIYASLDIWIDFDKFKSYYDYATKQSNHSFLYIDLVNHEFRVNFNFKIKNGNNDHKYNIEESSTEDDDDSTTSTSSSDDDDDSE